MLKQALSLWTGLPLSKSIKRVVSVESVPHILDCIVDDSTGPRKIEDAVVIEVLTSNNEDALLTFFPNGGFYQDPHGLLRTKRKPQTSVWVVAGLFLPVAPVLLMARGLVQLLGMGDQKRKVWSVLRNSPLLHGKEREIVRQALKQ
jgi:hypothetical protein